MKYSEPWHIGIVDSEPEVFVLEDCQFYDITDFERREYTERVRDCVNACEGINHAAVPMLLDACKAIVQWSLNPDGTELSIRKVVRKAVDAIEKAEEKA